MNNFKHPLFDEILYFDQIYSTNKKAEQLIKSKQITGNFLITAKSQNNGIGRNNNSWFSPVGGIWLTCGLYGLSVGSNLTIFMGICIHKALIKLFPDIEKNLKIKWPNDIYLEEKKLAGILSTNVTSHKYHLIGIGINTNFSDFTVELSDISISLQNYFGNEIDNSFLITQIFDIFSEDLPEFINGNFDHDYFNKYSFLKDKKVVLDTSFARFLGVCKGINRNGAILLELRNGMIQPFFSGSINDYLE